MPFFIIGTPRPGSNLFRLMMNPLPTTSAPHSRYILERLSLLADPYGEMLTNEQFYTLADDVCKGVLRTAVVVGQTVHVHWANPVIFLSALMVLVRYKLDVVWIISSAGLLVSPKSMPPTFK